MLEFQQNCLRYPLDKTLGGPQSRPGRLEKRQYFASSQLLTTTGWWSSPWLHYTDDTSDKFTRKGSTGISVSTAKNRLHQTYLTSMAWYVLERRTKFLPKTRLSQCRIQHSYRFCHILFVFVSIANADCRTQRIYIKTDNGTAASINLSYKRFIYLLRLYHSRELSINKCRCN
jgi:hypothetical protein